MANYNVGPTRDPFNTWFSNLFTKQPTRTSVSGYSLPPPTSAINDFISQLFSKTYANRHLSTRVPTSTSNRTQAQRQRTAANLVNKTENYVGEYAVENPVTRPLSQIGNTLGDVGTSIQTAGKNVVNGVAQAGNKLGQYGSLVADPLQSALTPVDWDAIGGNKKAFADAMLPYARLAVNKAGLYDQIDPRLLVAMAANETGYGQSKYIPNNNLFGIKSQGNQPATNNRTFEYVNGKKVYINDNFRSYGSPLDSFMDVLNNFQNDSRGKYQSVLGYPNQSPYRFADALQKAGWATDPRYANNISSIFNDLFS